MAATGFTLLSFQLDYFPVLEVRVLPIYTAGQLKLSLVPHFRFRTEVDIASQRQVPSVYSNLVFVPLTLRSALYAVLYEHWAMLSAIIESSLRSMISNRTWNDPTPGLPEKLQGKLTGVAVFRTISDLIIQYVRPKSMHDPPLTSRAGYSTASKPRWRYTPGSTNLSKTLPNGFMYGRPVSYPIPQHSRTPFYPTEKPAN